MTLALVSSRRNTRLRAQTSIFRIENQDFFGPDGSSGQLAVKHATGAAKSLFGVSRWGHVENLRFWKNAPHVSNSNKNGVLKMPTLAFQITAENMDLINPRSWARPGLGLGRPRPDRSGRSGSLAISAMSLPAQICPIPTISSKETPSADFKKH